MDNTTTKTVRLSEISSLKITRSVWNAIDDAEEKLRKAGYEIVEFKIDHSKFKNNSFGFETVRLWLNIIQADGSRSMRNF